MATEHYSTSTTAIAENFSTPYRTPLINCPLLAFKKQLKLKLQLKLPRESREYGILLQDTLSTSIIEPYSITRCILDCYTYIVANYCNCLFTMGSGQSRKLHNPNNLPDCSYNDSTCQTAVFYGLEGFDSFICVVSFMQSH